MAEIDPLELKKSRVKAYEIARAYIESQDNNEDITAQVGNLTGHKVVPGAIPSDPVLRTELQCGYKRQKESLKKPIGSLTPPVGSSSIGDIFNKQVYRQPS